MTQSLESLLQHKQISEPRKRPNLTINDKNQIFPARDDVSQKEWENMYKGWGHFIEKFNPKQTTRCRFGGLDRAYSKCSKEYPCYYPDDDICLTLNGDSYVYRSPKASHLTRNAKSQQS
ncbi:MAG TPA: hypothetical protein PLS49_09035 [Candidatus Woesebacteria bacterium]|nr:hypothetical protein [Candidatus Woesebacteria bacterium]